MQRLLYPQQEFQEVMSLRLGSQIVPIGSAGFGQLQRTACPIRPQAILLRQLPKGLAVVRYSRQAETPRKKCE